MGRYNAVMPNWNWGRAAGLFLGFCLTTAALAQHDQLPKAPSATERPSTQQPANMPMSARPPVATHSFWDKENVLLFTGVGVFRGLDYASTKNMLARGREEVLIPDDVVSSKAGFPALEAAGTATSIGISYLMHRTNHHKLERWVSIVHIGVTGFGVVRNYSLKSNHSTPVVQ